MPYARWFRQRKLEYAYRLLTMPEERLPRLVSQACWPGRKGKGSKRMHGQLEVDKKVGLSTAVYKQQGASKANFCVDGACRTDCYDMHMYLLWLVLYLEKCLQGLMLPRCPESLCAFVRVPAVLHLHYMNRAAI